MVIKLSGVQFGLKLCMILKSNNGAVQVQFETTSMISDQNCMTWSTITTLLQPFWNRRIQLVPIFTWSSSRFVEKWRDKGFYISYPKKEMMQKRAKMVRFKTDVICNMNGAIYAIYAI